MGRECGSAVKGPATKCHDIKPSCFTKERHHQSPEQCLDLKVTQEMLIADGNCCIFPSVGYSITLCCMPLLY